MAGASRVGVDTAGGIIVGDLVPSVRVNGFSIACSGASIASHGVGVHSSPKMASKSATVFAGGIGVCRSGDAASCGHTASGSPDVNAG